MFKLVVLCAFFAAAAAEPGALIAAPYTQYSTYVAPASTTFAKYDTRYIQPSTIGLYPTAPLAYTHFIKKRSPQLPYYYTPSSYIAPNPYIASTPYVASAPLVSSAPILPAVAPVSPALHLIKKRSVSLLPTTYYTPQVYSAPAAPVLATSYASTAPLIPSTQWVSQPLAYTHLIKKRSAPLLSTYITPTSYSQQSRFDFQATHTPITSISYSSPIAYTSPYAYSHVY